MALNKKSIFASPDSVDGKIGVTGSGRGMTQYADTAKVAKQNQNAAAAAAAGAGAGDPAADADE